MPLAPVWKKSWKKAATKHEGYAALCPLIATSLSDLVPPVVALATAGCFIRRQNNLLYLYSLSIRSAIRLAIGLGDYVNSPLHILVMPQDARPACGRWRS